MWCKDGGIKQMMVEKISMADAVNMEKGELVSSYQQMLENMSKEELISEIGKLLVDKGLLLNSMDGYINELKEDNSRLNGLLADGTEVMDYWQDKYLEEKSKNDELQKKVDELAHELAKKSIATEGINVTNTDISLCVHEKLLEQVVKDTAKKCNDFIHALICKYNGYIDRKDGAYGNMHKEADEFAKEKFGVEVK
jgi:hypothetical protein